MAKYVHDKKLRINRTIYTVNSPKYVGTAAAGSPGNQRPLLSGLSLTRTLAADPYSEELLEQAFRRPRYRGPLGRVAWEHA